MMNKDILTLPLLSSANPRIYAYEDRHYPNLLKIGYTSRDVTTRVKEQYPILRPGEKPYKIVLDEPALKEDGSAFTDYAVHQALERHRVKRVKGEWFQTDIRTIKSILNALRRGDEINLSRDLSFSMRPEQQEAVEKTACYFKDQLKRNPKHKAKFLWNAKMRFGKTFTAYQLALKMNWKRLLVLTFKPAVRSAWQEDLERHVDFKEWTFQKAEDARASNLGKSSFVYFASLQDILGKNKKNHQIKDKNRWIHEINWDCVIFDEYHYGAWRESTQDLFEENDKEENEAENEMDNLEALPITANCWLYLSGTPFRAIQGGEFLEDQIFNWTYTDEQRAKAEWAKKYPEKPNPYAVLPRMMLMTYALPKDIQEVALGGEFDGFDLNKFFEASGSGKTATFIHEAEILRWLDVIRGVSRRSEVDNLKINKYERPQMPFDKGYFREAMRHTFWYLPSVAACEAMENLLTAPENPFWNDYRIIVAAGKKAGMGAKALEPVKSAMNGIDENGEHRNALNTKTITLSCGKLTTGVTVKPWGGILMLRNSQGPETYFQAAFRVQSPWTLPQENGGEEILKKQCYVFDFAPNRALRQVVTYASRLDINEDGREKNIKEFLNFLPVISYDGARMTQINADNIFSMAEVGTTASLLAKKWEDTLLVNVDDATLQRVLENQDVLDAVMRIEGFRALSEKGNIFEQLISKNDSVKALKKKETLNGLSPKEKKQLTTEEKEYKSLRKQVQDKLIKFAARIPIFMYLTDFREEYLKDIIEQLEPGLFRKVTGLTIPDFQILANIGLFNSRRMNDAVFDFKRYEDSSLEYTGLKCSATRMTFGWDSKIERKPT